MSRTTKKTLLLHAPLAGISYQTKKIPIGKPSSAERTPAPTPAPQVVPSLTQQAAQNDVHLQTVLQEIGERIAVWDAARTQNVHELQEVAVELGVAIASHVLKEKLDADELQLGKLVMSAVERLLPCDRISVKLHPADVASLQTVLDSELKSVSDLLELVEDADLPRGSCLVSGDGHGLMSTLDGKLENIRETLLQGIEHARIERRKAVGIGGSLQRFPDRRKLA